MAEQPGSVGNFNDVGQIQCQKKFPETIRYRAVFQISYEVPISGAGIVPRLSTGNNLKLSSYIKSMYQHNLAPIMTFALLLLSCYTQRNTPKVKT